MAAWYGPRSVNGGIDEIPLPPPGLPGRLFLCGKHAIAPDPATTLASVDANVVVCLTHEHELADRYPAYVEWLRTNMPARAMWHPIADLHAPSEAVMVALVAALRARLSDGDRLVVHCAAGIGRSGTVAVALLLSMGVPLDAATTTVRSHRPMAGPESGPQRDLVVALSARYRSLERPVLERPTP